MKQIREDTGICHLRVTAPVRLKKFLREVDLAPLKNPGTVDEWLHYGSVYVDGQRIRIDMNLQPAQIVRLHTRRKTYVTQIPDLRERVRFENQDLLVLDKPSGLPTHATLDNYVENAAYILSQQLGYPVYVTHRLDVATHGLLILAKSAKAQAALNKQFAKRQVEKIYRARTSQPVPLGLHTHWMNPESRVPKQISAQPVPGWWECQLEVLASGPQTLIRLITGKTHQIRAQFAAMGSAVDGDYVYGSKVPAREGQIDLECFGMNFRWLQKDLKIDRSLRTGPEPSVPL